MRRSTKSQQNAMAQARKRVRLLEQLEERTNMTQYSFAGVTFEQNSTPDTNSRLAAGAYNSAVVTGLASGSSSGVAFPTSSVGFDQSRALGAIITPTGGPRAISLAGTNGSAVRNGTESTWSNNRLLPNNSGDDFVIYESGTVTAGAAVPEAYMVQVFNASSSAWTSWYYFASTSSGQYGGTGSEGAFATEFDLSDMGVGASESISKIRIVNMTAKDRMVSPSGEGQVIPEDNGATSTTVPATGALASFSAYGNATYDADPLYIGVFGSLSLNLTVDNAGDTNDGDYSTGNLTLREAVTLANNVAGANEITFAGGMAGQTITLGSELAITDDLTITGLGADQLTINGNAHNRIFNVNDSTATVKSVSISGLKLTGGSSAGPGGALTNNESLTLNAVDISNNGTTSLAGGGIANSGTLVLSNSVMQGNAAHTDGGAIYNTGTLTVVNTTLSVNSANGKAGGIENAGGTATIASSTLAQNIASTGAGGIDSSSGSVVLRNTIVAGSVGGDIGSGSISGSNNLIASAGSAGSFVDGTNGNIVGNSGSGTLALSSILDPTLTNNGGTTRTHALAIGSPALDAGDNTYATITGLSGGAALSFDQRGSGHARILNTTVDIGAYEAIPQPADVGVSISSPTTINAGERITYTLTVTNSGLGTATNVTLNDAVPAGSTLFSFTQTSGPTFSLSNTGVTGTVMATRSSLAPGASATFEFVVRVNSNAAEGSSVDNTASVTTTASDASSDNDSDSASATVTISADVSGFVAVYDFTYSGGEDISYEIIVTSNGYSDATNVHVTDTLPAGTTLVSFTQTQGPTFSLSAPAVGETGTVTADIATLEAPLSARFILVVHIDSSAADGSVIENTATATGSGNDPNQVNDSTTVSVDVVSEADLGVSLDVDPAGTVFAGDQLIYTITVTNDGPSDAFDAAVSSAVPAGTTFVSLTHTSGPTLEALTPPVGGTGAIALTSNSFPAGATSTYELVVAVDSSLAAGSTVDASISASTSADDGNLANDSDSTSTNVAVSTDVGVEVTASPAGSASPGGHIIYTVTVTNHGPSDATNVFLLDTLPPDTTFFSIQQTGGAMFNNSTPNVGETGNVLALNSYLPAGGFGAFEINVLVSGSATEGSSLDNAASVSSSSSDPDTDNNSVTTSLTVAPAADVSVTLTPALTTVTAGEAISYTITVTNDGPGAAANVSFSDVLPAGTTFVLFSQNSGPTFSTTTPTFGQSGTVSADVASLAAGESAEFQLLVKVDSNVASGTVISNTADVSSATSDPDTNDHSASTSVTIQTLANVSIQLSDDPDPVVAGNDLTYTITVKNVGSSDAHSVQWSDLLPAGTTFVSLAETSPGSTFDLSSPSVGSSGTVSGSIASLPSLATVTFELVVKVGSNVAQDATLSNTATISTTTADSNPDNDEAEATTAVDARVDVFASISDPGPATAGEDLVYTINIQNSGPSDAQNAAFSIPLPAGVTFVSLQPVNLVADGFTPSTPAVGSNGTVSASIVTLPRLNNGVFTLTVHVGSNVASGTVLSTTATGTTDSVDILPANDAHTANTTVGTEADLGISISHNTSQALAGEDFVYTINLGSDGPSDAKNFSWTATLPAGATFVSLVQLDGPTFNVTTPAVGTSGNISANIATFGLTNARYKLTMHVAPDVAAGTSLAATVALTSDTADPFSDNNSSTVNDAGVIVATQADVAVTLDATPSSVVLAGSNLTYVITVTNNGPSDASHVAWSTLLNSNLTFVSLSQTTGLNFQLHPLVVGTTGSVSATIATLPSGSSATFQLIVLVTPSTPNGTNIATSVAVTTDTTDPGDENNSDQIATIVSHPVANLPGQFLVALNKSSGMWYGSHLATGHSQIVANFEDTVQDGIVGDFNGDGVSDLAGRNLAGQWLVSLAQPGNSFPFPTDSTWATTITKAFDKITVADVNKDGKADIIAYSKAAGSNVYLFRSTGHSFVTQVLPFAKIGKIPVTFADFQIADFNGDGRSDFAARVKTAPAANASLVNTWYVSIATASAKLLAPKAWGKWDATPRVDVRVADYNGDGKADIVARDPKTGLWQVSQATAPTGKPLATHFVTRKLISWGADKAAKWHNVVIADLNDDGKDDIVGQNSQGYWFWIHQGGTATAPTNLLGKKIGRWLPAENYKSVFVADLDHDGKDELIGRRGTSGIWRIDHLNPANTKLTTDTAANHRPDWDQSVDWMFAALGDDDQGLF